MVSFNSLKIAAALVLLFMMAAIPVASAQPGFVAQTVTGSLTATGSVVMPVTADTGAIAWQITGTFVGTVTFEGTVDGTNYVAAAVVPVGTTRTLASTATAAGMWQMNASGFKSARARCSAYTSGTIVITGRRAATTPPPQ